MLVEKRDDLRKKLAEAGVESNQVHYRNDIYSVFGGRVDNCPNMDRVESKYLVLPMHYHLTVADIEYICAVIKEGW